MRRRYECLLCAIISLFSIGLTGCRPAKSEQEVQYDNALKMYRLVSQERSIASKKLHRAILRGEKESESQLLKQVAELDQAALDQIDALEALAIPETVPSEATRAKAESELEEIATKISEAKSAIESALQLSDETALIAAEQKLDDLYQKWESTTLVRLRNLTRTK